MNKKILLLLSATIALAVLSLGAFFLMSKNRRPTPVKAIPVTQAREFAGQEKTLEGKIQYIYNNGKSVLLGFSYPHQGVFKVQIPKSVWGKFGPNFGSQIGRNLETTYEEGQTIQVTGKIEWYQGDPAIYAQNPRQIKVEGESTPLDEPSTS